ncbi:hypothetical protein K435DRAFT_795647 [Dendrothele bispora CBS 962.96]|uniref:AIG1-type G domain-containing protein n=1 Tax=Dendrothele bispora (strain CBS 962.96) TaxID=1314807 RepID=A0A4S8M7Z2_DENBC|nr:hypothetical protein K435DRAFT_795647 [Dendrothele bispora CBS 962.96]
MSTNPNPTTGPPSVTNPDKSHWVQICWKYNNFIVIPKINPLNYTKLLPVSTNPNANNSDPDTDSDDDVEQPTINDVPSLRNGIIKTVKNTGKVEFTILVVGETGVGKSSVLEFIANVLAGNSISDYNFSIIDETNESGGSGKHIVRILDTPGLADTRGIEQDEKHKKSIANVIAQSITTVNAVIILANGTVPRITVGTDYALSTLSSIFPRSLANNIAFLFTNVSSPLSWNFAQDTVPPVLKNAPQYLLDNPLALQKKYLSLKDSPNTTKQLRSDMRAAVKAGEEKALFMLVRMFDWLDGLPAQPTKDILSLYDQAQQIETQINNTLAQMDQAALKRQDIQRAIKELETAKSVQHGHLQHYNVIWEDEEQTQNIVDEEMKKKFMDAKSEKEKKEHLKKMLEGSLDTLTAHIETSTEELATLASKYADLSLSGSFSGQVEKAVKMLEQNHKAMEEKGVDKSTLDKVQKSLDEMKRKLDLLRKAQKENQGIIRRVFNKDIIDVERSIGVAVRFLAVFLQRQVDTDVWQLWDLRNGEAGQSSYMRAFRLRVFQWHLWEPGGSNLQVGNVALGEGGGDSLIPPRKRLRWGPVLLILMQTTIMSTVSTNANNKNAGDDNQPTINDIPSLRNGIIKTVKSTGKVEFTILVVGETGVGKSSVLEFIANVLAGNSISDYDFKIIDEANESDGSGKHSQTNSAKLYSFTSKNGVVLKAATTRSASSIPLDSVMQGVLSRMRDKRSITDVIAQSITAVNAVIMLANGAVPRVTVGNDYAFSALSAIFPRSLANNIALLLTNVPSPLHWNFAQETIPSFLKHAPQFLLDNPLALQKKYLSLKDSPNMTDELREDMRAAVKAGEEKGLSMLVHMFDWLDGLPAQPTKEILSLYELAQQVEIQISNTLAQMDQAALKKQDIEKVMKELETAKSNMDSYKAYETQTGVDEDMKKKFMDAQSEKEKQEHLQKTLEGSLDTLTRLIENSIGELATLASSFSGQVEKAVKMLEQKNKAMEEKGVDKPTLDRMQKSLDEMKRELDLLRKAQK